MAEVLQAQGVTCPICGWSGESFEPMGRKQRPNAQCPSCKSLERHRALFLYVRDESTLFTRPARVLHFAPEPSLRRVFEDHENLEYVTTDLEMPDVSMRMDIHDLVFRDGTFDFVICSHVLEHVDDDRAAMREIRRVLRPEGTALIMVPILSPGGRTFEDPTITTPEGRERAFGQTDHVRRYGGDFPERAREAGLEVEAFRPLERWGSAAEHYALYPGEILFVGGQAKRPDGRATPEQAAATDAPDRDRSPSRDPGEEVEIWFDTRISPQDPAESPDRLDRYFEVGLEALRLVEDALAVAGASDPESILDFPSGYGRVLRMLRARFPAAAITACDADHEAVDFCERTFGVSGAKVHDLEDPAPPGTFALIWSGSLLTRLPEDDARAALRSLARLLAVGGVFVFTANGPRIRGLVEAGRVTVATEHATAELLAAYDDRGFGFAAQPAPSNGPDGFAVASRIWVEAELDEVPGLVHLHSSDAAWDGRQDVYVCRRD